MGVNMTNKELQELLKELPEELDIFIKDPNGAVFVLDGALMGKLRETPMMPGVTSTETPLWIDYYETETKVIFFESLEKPSLVPTKN
jgi:hypothetical protein